MAALQKLQKSQSAIKAQFTNIEKELTAQNGAVLSQVKYTSISAYLKKYKDNMEKYHSDIYELLTSDAEETAQDTEYTFLCGRYWKLLEDLEILKPESNVPATTRSKVKLPDLPIPTFEGDIDSWTSFYDLFTASVHNNSDLSDAQKLQYLKSLLKKDAASIIKHLQVTDSNYDEAWKLLKNRYDNKREIINSHLRRFISQCIMKDESSANLRKLIDVTRECIQALKVLGQSVDQWDSILIFLIQDKLDSESRRQWILSLTTTTLPTFEDFMKFLDTRARAICESGTVKPSGTKSNSHDHAKKVNTHYATNSAKCGVCNDAHYVYQCPTFAKLSIPDRRSTLQKKDLCFNCMRPGHRTNICRSEHTCKKCQGKHHTMLHSEKPKKVEEEETTTVKANTTSLHVSSLCTYHTVLPTAVINVKTSKGDVYAIRALLDSGSEVSFVTSRFVKKAGCTTQRTHVKINGVSATEVGSTSQVVQLHVSSRIYSYSTTIEAYVLPRITSRLPSVQLNPDSFEHFKALKLADPFYYKPEEIDLLIGADLFASLLRPTAVIMGPQGTPNAVDTLFGWVVSGQFESSKKTSISSHHVHCELESIMQKFWEVETTPAEATYTKEEQHCEQHFMDTHSRLPNGRYVVSLPFKPSTPKLGSSRDMAIRRLLQVEKRLILNPDLHKQYVDFMREYQCLGHMERVPANVSASTTYYLPHHCVLKESSSTTKVRVVFDGSAKSSSGVSLNQLLMVGPKTQDDLIALLLRFRMWLIAMVADAKMMYRQFIVTPNDRQFQRIVWRESPEDPIQDWQLTTVTYGTAAAPFLATRCLKQLALDEANAFPNASITTLRDTYVDDLMTGTNSVSEAIQLKSELLELFKRGGIELRKWSSNNIEFLETLSSEFRETKLPFNIDDDSVIKTLGLMWNPCNDFFTFTVNVPTNREHHTKRSLLSDMSKVFDPLGWLSPITIKIKILFQSLWKLDLTWDSPLPSDVRANWEGYRDALHCVENIQIPRHAIFSDCSSIDLLGFCDASQLAYAAAVYVRSTSSTGYKKVTLLMSKTRVAPAKQESLPRLELLGAVLLVKLVLLIRNSLINTIGNVYLWTDSTIVLHWIAAPSTKWQTFVANRVSQIQQSFPREYWHHVRSEDNPADCASRGIQPNEIEQHPLWWTGPSWATLPTLNFNEDDITMTTPAPEAKRIRTHACTDAKPIVATWDFTRYSSLNHMKIIAGWIFRFYNNCKVPKEQRVLGHLTVTELRFCLHRFSRLVQQEVFPREYDSLSNDIPITTGTLIRLSPFMKDDLIRVGGRIRYSDLSPDRKHPILLPKVHHFTQLVIRQAHLMNLHAGPQLTLSSIQQTFWIIFGRDVVRRFICKCVVCYRQKAAAATQQMGNLPASRLVPTHPFQVSGVDFAGPFILRRVIGGRSNQTFKSYIAVFVCFVTHALHLELVSDLTSDAFIACLKRFTGRRGICSSLYSDCGSNFVGADKELRQVLELLRDAASKDRIQRFLSTLGVTWHFNPPSAPHMGGLWESGVKSVKAHLKRVIGTQSLNFEELATILAQVEACVNSRPLSPMSSDPEDLSAVTPGHFLVGRPLNAIPEVDLTDVKLNRLSRWQVCQQITQHFWNRWRTEYLSSLQQRQKWQLPVNNLKIGTLVLVKDERLPPTQWKMARVIEVHPGSDKLIRVVTIRTSDGTYKRPIAKLCPLPVSDVFELDCLKGVSTV